MSFMQKGFERAALVGNVDEMRELIESFPNNIDLALALQNAVIAGSIDSVRFILMQDHNHTLDIGTPIQLAEIRLRRAQRRKE